MREFKQLEIAVDFSARFFLLVVVLNDVRAIYMNNELENDVNFEGQEVKKVQHVIASGTNNKNNLIKNNKTNKPKRKSNGRNSPVIGENGVNATPDEISKIARDALDIYLLPPIDTNDPDQLKERFIEYVEMCIERGMRPGNMGLYSAWGIDRKTLYRQVANDPGSPRSLIIKKCTDILSNIREQLMATGKINPVTGIFWQKNFDGLKDQQDVIITPNKTLEAEKTPDQIEQDIPIDVD